MPNKYYYLVSLLPYLEFKEDLPISSDALLTECAKWLTEKDLDILKKIDINNFEINQKDPDIVKDWKRFDRALREELKEIRISRKDTTSFKIPPLFKHVFDEPTPLAMERELARMRWNYIDEIEFGYYFDINVIILYFLKLQIIKRLLAFDKEKGKNAFRALSEVNYE